MQNSSPTSRPWHRLGPVLLESYMNSQFLVTAATNMSSIVIAPFVTRCEEYVTYSFSREYRTTAGDAIESIYINMLRWDNQIYIYRYC
jgi:hypothetical protein